MASRKLTSKLIIILIVIKQVINIDKVHVRTIQPVPYHEILVIITSIGAWCILQNK